MNAWSLSDRPSYGGRPGPRELLQYIHPCCSEGAGARVLRKIADRQTCATRPQPAPSPSLSASTRSLLASARFGSGRSLLRVLGRAIRPLGGHLLGRHSGLVSFGLWIWLWGFVLHLGGGDLCSSDIRHQLSRSKCGKWCVRVPKPEYHTALDRDVVCVYVVAFIVARGHSCSV